MKIIVSFSLFILAGACILSCSNHERTSGAITEIWLEPHAGIANFSYIYIYLESNDPRLFEQIENSEIDKIEVIGINGFDYYTDEIRKTLIDTVGSTNRYVISIQTGLGVVKNILKINTTISKIEDTSFLYEISTTGVGVQLESKDLRWSFGVWNQGK
ncbi:MAG: hypothetical protein C0592_03610 [Marinilabiliales bacterium]|nr:MAG: hypothetical protein C0592_03610 [Marinilabiliales bacterium]